MQVDRQDFTAHAVYWITLLLAGCFGHLIIERIFGPRFTAAFPKAAVRE
jgi:hypothetical protein